MKELEKDELREVGGGFLWLLVGIAEVYILQAVVVGLFATSMAASYESGYKSVIEK